MQIDKIVFVVWIVIVTTLVVGYIVLQVWGIFTRYRFSTMLNNIAHTTNFEANPQAGEAKV